MWILFFPKQINDEIVFLLSLVNINFIELFKIIYDNICDNHLAYSQVASPA